MCNKRHPFAPLFSFAPSLLDLEIRDTFTLLLAMSSHGSTASGPTGKSTVAPPALNVYKKVAVIRKPSDSLTYEDAEGNIKSVSAEELGDAIAHAVRVAFFRIIVLLSFYH